MYLCIEECTLGDHPSIYKNETLNKETFVCAESCPDNL